MDSKTPICGIIMPISFIDGCNEAHWQEVLDIISRSVSKSGFEPNLVSNADEIGFIHKRIIQNLYDNPIIVCDVSGKNANVMFELGMRLAFDKPTVIIKDDKTSYSFDTSPIEHLTYPRDLRFSQIEEFQNRLSEKIRATYDKSVNTQDFTAFLGHFGDFTVQKIKEKEVSPQEYLNESILEEMRYIKKSLRYIEISQKNNPMSIRRSSLCMRGFSLFEIDKAVTEIQKIPGVLSANAEEFSKNHLHIHLTYEREARFAIDEIKRKYRIPPHEIQNEEEFPNKNDNS